MRIAAPSAKLGGAAVGQSRRQHTSLLVGTGSLVPSHSSLIIAGPRTGIASSWPPRQPLSRGALNAAETAGVKGDESALPEHQSGAPSADSPRACAPAVITLSEAAMRYMCLAEHEAQTRHATQVEPIHMILALLRPNLKAYGFHEATACEGFESVLSSHGITYSEADQLVGRGSHMAGNSAELPEIEFGIQACEVVRDAMLIASRAGFTAAHPVHLLMALTNMAPLPTVLYNPVVWLLQRSQGRTAPITTVMNAVHRMLVTGQDRAAEFARTDQQAGAGRTDTTNLRLCLPTSVAEPSEGPRVKGTSLQTLVADISSMSLTQLAVVLRWCLDDKHCAVLTPQARDALSQRLAQLDSMGLFAADHPTSNGCHYSGPRKLKMDDWVALLEGAKQLEITLPASLIHGVIRAHLDSPTNVDLKSAKGRAAAGHYSSAKLLSAVLWHLAVSRGCPDFMPWLQPATTHSALCGLLKKQLKDRELRPAWSTAQTIAVLVPHEEVAGGVLTAAVRCLLEFASPVKGSRPDPLVSAQRLAQRVADKQLSGQPDDAVVVLAIMSYLLPLTYPDWLFRDWEMEDGSVPLQEVRPLLPHLTARAGIALLRQAPVAAVHLDDIESLAPHMAQGLLTPLQLVALVVRLESIWSASQRSISSAKHYYIQLESSWWDAWSNQMGEASFALHEAPAARLLDALAGLADMQKLPPHLLTADRTEGGVFRASPACRLGVAVIRMVHRHSLALTDGRLYAAASRLAQCTDVDSVFRDWLAQMLGRPEWDKYRRKSPANASSSSRPATSIHRTTASASLAAQTSSRRSVTASGFPGSPLPSASSQSPAKAERSLAAVIAASHFLFDDDLDLLALEESASRTTEVDPKAQKRSPVEAASTSSSEHYVAGVIDGQEVALGTESEDDGLLDDEGDIDWEEMYGSDCDDPDDDDDTRWWQSDADDSDDEIYDDGHDDDDVEDDDGPWNPFYKRAGSRAREMCIRDPPPVTPAPLSAYLPAFQHNLAGMAGAHTPWPVALGSAGSSSSSSMSEAFAKYSDIVAVNPPPAADLYNVLQLLKSLRGLAEGQRTGVEMGSPSSHEALRLLVQCASLGVTPGPEVYGRLWSALEPGLGSLTPLQQAEAIWATSTLQQATSQAAFTRVTTSVPTTDPDHKRDPAGDVMTLAELQTYSRLLAMLANGHAGQVPGLAPEVQQWVEGACKRVYLHGFGDASEEEVDKGHPTDEMLEALASCAVSLSQLCPTEGYQLAAHLFRVLKPLDQGSPNDTCLRLAWAAAYALRQYSASCMPTSAQGLQPQLCDHSHLELSWEPVWLHFLPDIPLKLAYSYESVTLVVYLLQAVVMLEEVEAAAAYWEEPCPVPAGWRKYLWHKMYEMVRELPSIDKVLEYYGVTQGPGAGSGGKEPASGPLTTTEAAQPSDSDSDDGTKPSAPAAHCAQLLDVCELLISLCTTSEQRLYIYEVRVLLGHINHIVAGCDWGCDGSETNNGPVCEIKGHLTIPDPRQEARRQLLVRRVSRLQEKAWGRE